MSNGFNKFSKPILSYFWQGLLYTTPLGATVFFIYLAFNFLNGLTKDVIQSLFNTSIPGLGIVLMFAVITTIGYFGKSLISKPLVSFIDSTLDKTPFIKIIYTSIKDLLQAFVGQKKKFSEPVLVKVNKESDIQRIGFVTQRDLSQLGIDKEHIAVYFPFSFGYSGALYVVPAENVTPVTASPTEVMKFVISGGVTEIY
jgi:uncharacterized membrane protein